ncbi:Axl2p Ecym_5375 [Eremothecium cymbalariae DBVPG|uniref:Dystroglycan-type cadherin-like domain-containing protein n=1 Tax=Eremothecium cymbalariae (strain CBS 270.75 / DBVPG 7215 / KCTC 17166 / NRRL Y-17582) TaxID=931890 RepID=I6NDI8_ERECY|nr:hypothetical protein Ecym_5375 [Eremothecium cymbalariae DBVPG\
MLLSILLFISALLYSVSGKPYESYSVNKQFPPVARLGQYFSFQLSNDTYKSESSSSEIAYEVFGLPDWLSWDRSNRVLSGTFPSEFLDSGDTKYFGVTLQGTDLSDGQSLNATYQLVATSQPAVNISSDFNLLSLLKNYGQTDGRKALKLSPGADVNLTFERDMFAVGSSSRPIVAYYGRSKQYHAPLPPWLSFDSAMLKFSGSAPVVNSDIAPEVDYSFSLIATDIEGFAGAEMSFDLIVGAHQLTTTLSNSLVVNVTDSGSFDYEIPFKYVFLDNYPISEANISTMTLQNAPDWATLKDNHLVGTLPSLAGEANFTVAISDVYRNNVFLDVSVKYTQQLFAVNSFANVNATKGSWFEHSLSPSQFTKSSGLNISVEISDADWLSFIENNLTLSGEVPDSFSSTTVNVTVAENGHTESLPMKIIGVDFATKAIDSSATAATGTASATSGSSTSSIVSASGSSTSEAGESSSKKKNSSLNKTIIACSIAIPLFFLLIIIPIILVLRKRRRPTEEESDLDSEQYADRKISGPQLGNPANNPNPFVLYQEKNPSNPFDDDASSLSSAKKLGVLNAIQLEDSSENSLENEKMGSDDDSQDGCEHYGAGFYRKEGQPVNSENWLSAGDHEGDSRRSSVFYNSQPSKRKSWRYSSHMANSTNNNRRVSNRSRRESYASVKTVSTADLLTTEVSVSTNILHDPRKSTLGARDSVFMELGGSKHSSDSRTSSSGTQSALAPLNETYAGSQTTLDPFSAGSLSGTADGSIKQENMYHHRYQYKGWKQQDSRPNPGKTKGPAVPARRKRSTKRLVKLENKGGVNVSDVNLIGQEPERD